MKKWLQLLVFYSGFTPSVFCQISFLENGYTRTDSVEGAVLYEKSVTSGNYHYQVYCQTIDLQRVKLSQFMGKPDKMDADRGYYLTDRKDVKSPYFPTYSSEEALDKIEKKANSKLLGMFNGGFFESFDATTQMAFPVKNEGKIATSGSSPNGPCVTPKYDIFKKITLKALVWTDSTVEIKDYDPKTGTSLTNDAYKNGLVTYSYNEHPVNLLRPLSVDKFLVMGTFNSEQTGADNMLVILTVNKMRIEFAAAHLRKLGVKSAIIALGGSGSAFIHNRKKGFIEPLPTSPNRGQMMYKMILPHYLFFTKK